ncbi:tyrosine-type recombinase/integrase [Methylobacterium sp. WL6]|nr:tyrosine-type recombinase/integrase [Methylobacterium sp. WL6]
MARPKQPSRLVFDRKRQVWAIADFIDGERYKRRTRHGLAARGAAQEELALHIAEQGRLARERLMASPDHDDPANSNPRLVSVAACLTFYGARMEGTKNAALVGQHIVHLLRILRGLTLAQIRGSTCRDYVEKRTSERYTKPGWKISKPISTSTARRELGTLSAAINAWHREYNLSSVPVLELPKASKGHPDWLTESEFERLLKAASGFRWFSSDIATREPYWQPIEGLRHEPGDQLVRFLQIAFYSGTRSAAVLDLRWRKHKVAGYVDFPTVTMFREGPEAPASRKRQPPCRIHDRLLPLLKEWREEDLAAGVSRVVHRNGAAVKRVSKGFRMAAIRACLDRRDIDGTHRVTDLSAGLAADLPEEEEGYLSEEAEGDADEMGWPTPHILRHSRATIMLRAGVPPVEVSEYLGMSLAMVLKVYGHTSSAYQKAAAAA